MDQIIFFLRGYDKVSVQKRACHFIWVISLMEISLRPATRRLDGDI